MTVVDMSQWKSIQMPLTNVAEHYDVSTQLGIAVMDAQARFSAGEDYSMWCWCIELWRNNEKIDD